MTADQAVTLIALIEQQIDLLYAGLLVIAFALGGLYFLLLARGL